MPLSAAIKKLGFARVEETAIGAASVSHEYAHIMQTGQMKGIIATACSSVVMLIERHFPSLVKNLAPVSSPMMAHARLMREAYGDIKVVFVGPCLSKMYEAEDPLAGGLVNAVLTFEDLDNWFLQEEIVMDELDDQAVGVLEPISRIYPKQEGIIKTIGEKNFNGYTPISVDGIDRCIEFFSEMQKDPNHNIFVEANICAGSCIGGPVMRMHQKSIISATTRLKSTKDSIDDTPAQSASLEFPHPRVFANRSIEVKLPTEDEIKDILAKIGKTTKEQELNCGSCGYATCRAKAIAVFNGKADGTMCLPFLREKAENMSSMVIENSPNGIITFDETMLVTELNPKAEELFGVERSTIIGELIPALYGETAFDEAMETRKPIEKKCSGYSDDIRVELTVIYLKKNHMFIAFAKDISDEEHNKQELEEIRLSTVGVAQNVIDKQMRVAQEIASLLGETTAETKVALTKLKKSIKEISKG
ncbi:MAG: [Fe-Fe] hydrogenase large subunit C-terminal domain-containing protein [Oscillospiraceae bacterium]